MGGIVKKSFKKMSPTVMLLKCHLQAKARHSSDRIDVVNLGLNFDSFLVNSCITDKLRYRPKLIKD